MPIITFSGFVTPEAVIKQAGAGPLTWTDPVIHVATMTYRIVDSAVYAECQAPNTDLRTVHLLYMWTLAQIRSLVDIVAFTNGIGLTVILDRYAIPPGEPILLKFCNPALAASCSLPIDVIGSLTA